MLPQIVRHSKLVTAVAMYIAAKLNEAGMGLDLSLVQAGALLHDIAKTMCLETSGNHAEKGSDLLIGLGYSDVAAIVRQHIRLDQGTVDPVVITEIELVNYADKRVKHEEIVDLKERFRDIHERYQGKFPGLEEALDKVFQETVFVEEKIFSSIHLSPDQIVQSLFEDFLGEF
jgi:putative nucleotidyltransferase with HDIG domain